MSSHGWLHPQSRILIVGAGIAGLTLAVALSRQGVQATIVERSQTLLPRGLGLYLWPNAVHLLNEIGVGKTLIERSVVHTERSVVDPKGNVVSHRVLSNDEYPDAPGLGVYRNALLQTLVENTNATIRRGNKVRQISQQTDRVAVEFEDGTHGVFDLVVGADGLNSSVRRLVIDSKSPTFRHINAWRVVIPLQTSDRAHRILFENTGREFGAFPVSDDLLYVFVLVPGSVPRDTSQAEHLHLLLDATRDFEGIPRAIMERVSEMNPNDIFFAPVYEIEIEKWHHGGVVLIGDAAHAMLPFLAQGAAMAIEDAVLLAQALGALPSLADALAHYARVRKPRIQEVRSIVRAHGVVKGMQDPVSEEKIATSRQLLADRARYVRRLLNLPDDDEAKRTQQAR